MDFRVTALKERIREAQKRLGILERRLRAAKGDEADDYFDAYCRVLSKMERLCSELQARLGWENTCQVGCSTSLNLEKPPLEVGKQTRLW